MVPIARCLTVLFLLLHAVTTPAGPFPGMIPAQHTRDALQQCWRDREDMAAEIGWLRNEIELLRDRPDPVPPSDTAVQARYSWNGLLNLLGLSVYYE